ncbi:MAG: hypothetical protein AVDCRST_MAG03-395 [uncultured Rubrobacteraceae bacterium]|uniref:Uncharacterized protein n=1 Tax=uncultured Rubrobacteraceae bacterium TaxID=349277 RepID=A0A6J4NLH4_9ACTN|nr:MAG: hypothetical protein AVDCRST_MAG03-395 [uncultured Rubrobacteraceae bacterium]
MFTGMESLVAHQERGELAREIHAGRLDRGLWTGLWFRREGRWSLWRPREIPAPTSMPSSRKIAHLRDVGFFTRI